MRRSFASAVLVACAAAPAPPPEPVTLPPGARVLFVGNSLTASNDLPRMVAILSAAAGAPLRVSAVTLPGASLGDHLEAGTAARRLQGERWDLVVLQQGPSSRPESRGVLRRDAARFAPLIRAAGARPALLMVWPRREEPEWFDDVHDSYAAAAREVGGAFLAAGDAWNRARGRVELYAPDGLHPTVAGTYAAALVIVASVCGRSPRGLPAPDGMPAEVAALLQEAAEESVRR